jgi:hypothetical protein
MFTDWPVEGSTSSAALTICVSPMSALHDAIKVLQVKSVRNRKILTKAFTEVADLTACDVLYMDNSIRVPWASIKKSIAKKSILTIAEMETTSNDGVIITLALVNGRMVFDIDSLAAREANLVISSKLLRLARKVQ